MMENEIRNEENLMEEETTTYVEAEPVVEEIQPIYTEIPVVVEYEEEEKNSKKWGLIGLGVAATAGAAYLGYKKLLKPRLMKHFVNEAAKQIGEDQDGVDVEVETVGVEADK